MQCFVTYFIGLFLQLPLASSQCLWLLVTLLVLKSTQVLRAEKVPGAFSASSARGGQHLDRTEDQLGRLVGQGTMLKNDRRKPRLCT
jgi:hypothetical protein